MKPKQHLTATFSFMVIAALLAACAGPVAAPMVTQVPPTATPMPSTATPKLVPPTATPTPDAATPVPPSPAVMGEVKLELGEITSQALAGNLLGDPTTRKYYVLLPPSYSTSDKRYPVVYVLHRYTSGAVDLVADITSSYKEALAGGDAQEMIFVFPDANNKLGGSFYLSSPTVGDYETYISQEFVKQIDATYRTLPDRTSRGITGCSMGGDGSMVLALKYPDVFSVAAPASGRYDWANDGVGEAAKASFNRLPKDFSDFQSMPFPVEVFMAEAAGAASNPDKPPFYLDMPVDMVNGEAQIVPEVFDKIDAVDPVHELQDYLAQPERLSAILIYHSKSDDMVPVELAQNFDRLLTDQGVEHEYLEVNGSHCYFGSQDYVPVVEFMSDHLLGETPEPATKLEEAAVAKIETLVDKTMQDNQIPGIAVGVVKDGQLVYAEGFGVAEAGTDRAMTPQTLFPMASLSKQFTTVAIMQLVEQGKIDLDAPLTTYLPDFKMADPRCKDITIRHLLADISGMPDWKEGDWDYTRRTTSPAALHAAIGALATNELTGDPGKAEYLYSNAGFDILGDVVAKVTGQSFEEVMQTQFFDPLGMASSSFLLADVDPAATTKFHWKDETGKVVAGADFVDHDQVHTPSDGLVSNIADMSRWMLVNLNKGELDGQRILDPASYDAMWTPQTDADWGIGGMFQKWGLGWELAELDGHPFAWWGGLKVGGTSTMILAPDDGLGIVVVANASPSPSVDTPWYAVDLATALTSELLGINE